MAGGQILPVDPNMGTSCEMIGLPSPGPLVTLVGWQPGSPSSTPVTDTDHQSNSSAFDYALGRMQSGPERRRRSM